MIAMLPAEGARLTGVTLPVMAATPMDVGIRKEVAMLMVFRKKFRERNSP